MRGQTYIGGRDIYRDFGVVITKGGYNDLLNYNEIKEPVSNDWPEYHGVEVDLSAVYLNNRVVNISFYGIDLVKTELFLDFLQSQNGMVLSSTFLTKGYQLRLLNSETLKAYRKGQREFSLTFMEDIPQRYTYIPVGYQKIIPDAGIFIDHVRLKSLGLAFTGSNQAFLRRGEAKENLTRSIETSDGTIYDTAGGYKEVANEIMLPLAFYIKGDPVQKPKPGDFNDDYNGDFKITRWLQTIRRADMSTFVACYESFLGLLTQPGEHTVSHKGISKKCYYKSASDFNIISVNPDIVVSFNLTLILTHSELNP